MQAHMQAQTKTAAGFTLIELLIVLAIIAVLAAIAYPSFTEHAIKSRRTEAKACLFELSQFMERHAVANNGSYLADGKAPALPSLSCTTSLSPHYSLGFRQGEPTATTYALEAIPKGVQAKKDTRCGTLALDQAGIKTQSGTGSVRDCW